MRTILTRAPVPMILGVVLLLAAGMSPSRIVEAGRPAADDTPMLAAAVTHPNIVFVLTDDLDVRLGTLAYMPHLKALVTDQGTTFGKHLVTLSLCCPSRASTLRGQYSHNTQVLSNSPPNGGFERFHQTGDENSTIATWLRAVGYRTVLLGKYLNGYPNTVPVTYIPPGWSEWYSPSGAHPNNAYGEYNYQLNENGHLVAYGSQPTDYLTDVLARKSVNFIQRAATAHVPFFMYIAPYVPHAPSTPAPRHANLFPNAKAPRLPSFNEADVSDKPAAIRNRPLLSATQIASLDTEYRRRLQSVQAVDEMIASLVAKLQATNQLSNTYIVFSSDNGYHMGEHRLPAGKYTPYEEDLRVPLIVRGPGVPAGRVLSHLTGNIDLAPTFARLGGAAIPAFVDGRSLVPLLGSTPPALSAWRQAFLIEQWPNGGPVPSAAASEPVEPYDAQVQSDTAQFHGLHLQDRVYVEYSTGELELYDLLGDPYELQNQQATADQQFLHRLSSWLAALKSCAGAGCRTAEQAPPTP